MSCSSKKNFNVSLPLGPAWPMDCVSSQRSHSIIIRVFASFCFISAYPYASPLEAQMVALVWWGLVAPFESVG